jgi:hypothetical protein
MAARIHVVGTGVGAGGAASAMVIRAVVVSPPSIPNRTPLGENAIAAMPSPLALPLPKVAMVVAAPVDALRVSSAPPVPKPA